MSDYPEVTAWLVKKAREFRAEGTRESRMQADTAAMLASKISRGAVRPNNLRMLPDPMFFEVDRTYWREHHGRRIEFLVRLIDITPDGAKCTAFGWRRFDGEDWEPSDSDDFTGWTDVTEGQAPTSQHYDKVPDPLDGCRWCACGNRWPCKGSMEVTS